MLAVVAVCPHPPLIVPELAGAAAAELDDLRAACGAAVDALLATDHDLLVVVGGGPATRAYGERPGGSLRPWGVDVRVGDGEPVLPLSLTVGAWLLGDGAPRATYQAIAEDAAADACLALGAGLVADRRVAMLVMGDGSACLTEKAPGYLDEAAQPYNDLIARALGGADPQALAGLDPVEAAGLWVGGRAALQVLAGAAAERPFTGRLLADVAPYGVGYFVATWS
ncbi:hypothetical protein ACIBG8_50530 [Nonomuraea sp. NPDC050556]|uniref:hypothetical protein n=1 Tax=Nonomuraea sp. NPDC050556 TaxID=3364369 RepID=UPI0037A802B4